MKKLIMMQKLESIAAVLKPTKLDSWTGELLVKLIAKSGGLKLLSLSARYCTNEVCS